MNKTQPIAADRIISSELGLDWIKKEELCYICSNLALNPRECLNPYQETDTCNAMFCYPCLKSYLEKKPFCPKCRSIITPDNPFKRPKKSKDKHHHEDVKVKCQFDCPPLNIKDTMGFNLNQIFQHENYECHYKASQCTICLKQIVNATSRTEHQRKHCRTSIRLLSVKDDQICELCCYLKGNRHDCEQTLGLNVKNLEGMLRQQKYEVEQLKLMSEIQIAYTQSNYNISGMSEEQQLFKNINFPLSDFKSFHEALKTEVTRQKSSIFNKESKPFIPPYKKLVKQ